ncbi:serine/threonine-protein kinase [Streptomyces pristinaespiralis]|uniref:serine/threonine-protein kinase n=1 Tax=Streptomyces pristinaespiralis TaxID=38300 RepID=UPI00378D2CAE
MTDDVGRQVLDGRFELVERLGSGGMGTVWRARDLALHREVAVKQVSPLAPEPALQATNASRVLRERVLREARALARISDPHVVTIYHVVEEGEGSYPWLVMELVPGGSLADRLDERTRLEPQEAARIGRQVLSALRTAHTAGICHRDVKPANVLLRPDGDAVLTDFGIAALQRIGSADTAVGSVPLTATGELIGTPEYLAPERIRGRDDDPASDLWSLGIMLYVCVEGHSPMRRPTALATMAAVIDGTVPPPVRAGALAPVLMELLVADPAARPSAQRLDAMLAAVTDGGTVPTRLLAEADRTAEPAPATDPQADPRPPSALPSSPLRKRAWLAAGAAALATALVATAVHFMDTSQNPSADGEKPSTPNKLGLLHPGTLKVAVYNSGGAGIEEPGIFPTGLDPDLARALGDRLGLKVEIVGVEYPSRMIDGVLHQEEDEEGSPGPVSPTRGFDVDVALMPGRFVAGENEQKLDLIHYFDVGYAVYAPWKTAQRIRSKADLCGMDVSMGSYEDLIEKTSYEECGPNPIEPALKNGNLDAFVTSLPWAVHKTRNSNGELHLSKADLTEDAPLVMAVDSSKPALREAITKTLDALIKSGEYGEMLADRALQDGAVTAARIIRSTPSDSS